MGFWHVRGGLEFFAINPVTPPQVRSLFPPCESELTWVFSLQQKGPKMVPFELTGSFCLRLLED